MLLGGCNKYRMPDYPAGYREFAYVANAAGNSVTVLDLVYLRQDRTLTVGLDPVALARNPVLNEVYALNSQPGEAAGSVSVIDTLNNEVVATIAVHRAPGAIAVDPSGARAYVANTGSNTVSVLDLKTRRAIGSFATGESPQGLAVASDDRTLVVTNRKGDTVGLYAIGSSPALSLRNTYAGCPAPVDPVILPNASGAFVACSGGHQVMSIALALPAEPLAARQDLSLTQDHLLAFLDVGQQPTHLTMKPDGGEVFVSNRVSDSISEIATTTNEVGSTYGIGNGPTHGVVSQDNSVLFVAASGADAVSLYSIDDGKFLSSIRTGSAPDALAFSSDQHLLLVADQHSGDVAVIRTSSRFGPELLTILPAGASPSALTVKAMQTKP